MELGVCYYPEHWDEETWQPDAARMRAVGLTWVRIGEFAWSRIEPSPNEFTWDWLDRAMDTLGAAGLKVVLGTPTATPPKWLCDAYPDIYGYDIHGHKRGFGSRRHYSFNSPSYLRESARITRCMAERYSSHSALGAWQTDNEYGCHDTARSYAPWDLTAFRQWLMRRYSTPDALNDAWWTRFWSMEYRSFDEVELPNLTVTEANPSHVLDFYRFCSDAVIAFNRQQVDILKSFNDTPITHNVMGYFTDFDHFALAKDLDFVSWDNYPLGTLEYSYMSEALKTRFMRSGHPDLISFVHDLYFGLKRRAFWVIEQQPGQVNWAVNNPLPEHGMVKLWSQQAFAHGAEVVSYFRWRAACGAQELMHAGLNKHDGTEDQAAQEAREMSAELAHYSHPARVVGTVALLCDYENLWATDLQPHAKNWRYWHLLLDYYRALRALGVDVTISHPRQNLMPFSLVLAPALHLVDDALCAHLQAYAADGGTLLVGPRSGMKSLSNVVHAPALKAWTTLTGTGVARVDALRPGADASLRWQGTPYRYHTWADLLEPLEAKNLAEYLTSPYQGVSALTEKTQGSGAVFTLGCWGDATLHDHLFRYLLERVGVSVLSLPEGVRVTQRDSLHYKLNFTPLPADAGTQQVAPYSGWVRDGRL